MEYFHERSIFCASDAWRGDNYGPAGVGEVREDFRLFGSLFKNAVVLRIAIEITNVFGF